MSGSRTELVKRTVVLSKEIDKLVEMARISLGMNKSAFLKFCILRFLDESGLISERAREKMESELNGYR
jgi:hypothetical protein